MPLDAQQVLFRLAQRSSTTPRRWFPTAAENRLFERLDTSGASTAQSVYAQLVEARFQTNGRTTVNTAVAVTASSTAPAIALESFSDELTRSDDGSYILQCPVERSRLMRRLVVPAPMRSAMHGLLREVLQLFQRAGIRYWAAGGTLLGAVRHGGLIPWDDDVDLAVPVEDELKLRAAFKYPCFHSSSDDDDNSRSNSREVGAHDSGCASRLVLEYVPLFGYKVYSRELPPPSSHAVVSSDDSGGGHQCLKYGYFVDIFLMRQCENRLILARDAARRTWRDEWWYADELFPLLQRPFADVTNGLSGLCSCPSQQLTVGHCPLPHLYRLYGERCMREAVIPRELHGRRLSHTLRIPLELI